MNIKLSTCCLFLLWPFILLAQEKLYTSLTIDPELKKNANAVVRLSETNIEVSSINSYKESFKYIVTVLNKNGNSHVNAHVGYDDGIDVKKLSARVYDRNGNEIKRYKKKDFKDVSAVSGGTLYSDSRVKYLDYTPINYPYTVEFYYEKESENTAFIPRWVPLSDYLISVEESSYNFVYNSSLGLKKREHNFSNYNFVNESIDGNLSYSIKNLYAIKREAMSPEFYSIVPNLQLTLNKFNYEGYIGENKNWNFLGSWMYSEMLNGRTELSDETKNYIKDLVSDIEDPIEKAKVIYSFVQENTRYISVQEGIGGIQPILASQVDKVKYGDCKGLSNYTKSLLETVGVTSYYTRLYGSKRLQSVNRDFVSFLGQTNHAMLAIPSQDDFIWLECTDQSVPFGYIANFTDDRDVFVITPEGGKIVHTKVYETEGNLQQTKAKINLSDDGNFDAEVEMNSYGTQYGHHARVFNKTLKDQNLFYKENYWSYINRLEVGDIQITNDKDSIVFKEKMKLKATKYASRTGNRILVCPNVFNKMTYVPPKYNERKLPFQIDRGYVDIDEYKIVLPDGVEIEALQDNMEINNEFGKYSYNMSLQDDNTLIFNRKFVLNKGTYSKEAYKAYRAFRKTIAKQDNARIVLKINQ